jgi:D-alanyl-D-alanine carboxypeptidase (penicillin-binding protein 5/6)
MMQLLSVNKLSTFSFFLSVFSLLFLAAPAQAQEGGGFTSTADFAVLLDMNSDSFLYEKKADERMTPSSMTKLLTNYILFERLKSGSVKMDDTFTVSEKAWKMGGSKMFVSLNTQVKISDLLKGIIIQSGNDACVVVAEGISGSEEAFAQEMNHVAAKLGMKNSNFKNASGWPEPDHYSTPRDLAILGKAIIRDFPEYYPMFAEREFTFHGIRQHNRNPLLGKSIGVDGLKTGHTEEAGYGIVASALQDGRRLISVTNGMKSEKERGTETERLLMHGFRDFEHRVLFKAGQVVDSADVWFGKTSTVPLVIEKDVAFLISRRGNHGIKVAVAYEGPIPAPIAKGQKIAELVVNKQGMEETRIPLIAGEDVVELSYFSRLVQKAKILILQQ